MAAKIGDMYLRDVAVPTCIVFKAQKYIVSDVSPTKALKNKIGLLLPNGEILFYKSRKKSMSKVPIDLKYINSKAGNLLTCLISTFIAVNAIEEINM